MSLCVLQGTCFGYVEKQALGLIIEWHLKGEKGKGTKVRNLHTADSDDLLEKSERICGFNCRCLTAEL